MIEAGTSKPALFDVVIVHSFSRFFRDHFELEFYVRKLAKNGVKLVSITQEMGDDPMHVMMRQIMALFDEYQPKENAKHVLRALKERIPGLKAIRDQSQTDADRAQAMAESAVQQAITPAMVQKFAATARERIPDRRWRLPARTPPRTGPAGGGGREGSPDHGIEGRSTPTAGHRLRRKIGYARRSQFCSELADGVGFEPTVRLHARRFSRPLP